MVSLVAVRPDGGVAWPPNDPGPWRQMVHTPDASGIFDGNIGAVAGSGIAAANAGCVDAAGGKV